MTHGADLTEDVTVTLSKTVTVTFEVIKATYTITSSAGEGGSISPAGDTTVESGGSQTYSIVAADGYKISDVYVDGESAGAVSTYTFTNVTANHTIRAEFEEEETPTPTPEPEPTPSPDDSGDDGGDAGNKSPSTSDFRKGCVRERLQARRHGRRGDPLRCSGLRPRRHGSRCNRPPSPHTAKRS